MSSIEDKINLLIKAVVYNDNMAKVALEYCWSEDKINQINNIMETFSKQMVENYNFADIEYSFKKLNINYQDIKSIFLTFYENHQYLSVLKRYLETSGDINSISIEYKDMYNNLCSANNNKKD